MKAPFFGITVLFLLLINTSVFAQFVPGNIFLGGNLHYSSIRSEKAVIAMGKPGKDTIKTLIISPHFGIFLSKNIAMVLGFSYNKEKVSFKALYSSEHYNSIRRLFFFKAFMRFHKAIGSNFSLFLHAEMNAGTGKYDEAGVV